MGAVHDRARTVVHLQGPPLPGKTHTHPDSSEKDSKQAHENQKSKVLQPRGRDAMEGWRFYVVFSFLGVFLTFCMNISALINSIVLYKP